MSKLFLLCGLVMLGTAPTQEKENSPEINTDQCVSLKANTIEVRDSEVVSMDATFDLDIRFTPRRPETSPVALELCEIPFVELEEEVELGFDTSEYLPEGFDPYAVYVNLDAISFIPEFDDEDLGFDTSVYLPEGFDPYSAPQDISGINFVEEEEVVDLGFDTAEYLPVGFDPYAKPFDLDSIVFIEEEEEIDLGFDTAVYLPDGFDPYVPVLNQ